MKIWAKERERLAAICAELAAVAEVAGLIAWVGEFMRIRELCVETFQRPRPDVPISAKEGGSPSIAVADDTFLDRLLGMFVHNGADLPLPEIIADGDPVLSAAIENGRRHAVAYLSSLQPTSEGMFQLSNGLLTRVANDGGIEAELNTVPAQSRSAVDELVLWMVEALVHLVEVLASDLRRSVASIRDLDAQGYEGTIKSMDERISEIRGDVLEATDREAECRVILQDQVTDMKRELTEDLKGGFFEIDLKRDEILYRLAPYDSAAQVLKVLDAETDCLVRRIEADFKLKVEELTNLLAEVSQVEMPAIDSGLRAPVAELLANTMPTPHPPVRLLGYLVQGGLFRSHALVTLGSVVGGTTLIGFMGQGTHAGMGVFVGGLIGAVFGFGCGAKQAFDQARNKHQQIIKAAVVTRMQNVRLRWEGCLVETVILAERRMRNQMSRSLRVNKRTIELDLELARDERRTVEQSAKVRRDELQRLIQRIDGQSGKLSDLAFGLRSKAHEVRIGTP